jgi:hypothetical protein
MFWQTESFSMKAITGEWVEKAEADILAAQREFEAENLLWTRRQLMLRDLSYGLVRVMCLR